MSLGHTVPAGAGPTIIEKALLNAIGEEISVVVAAGNERKNACLISPARMSFISDVITVAASNRIDVPWIKGPKQGTNYGKCVSLFAPGQYIATTHPKGVWRTTGTSFAAPFVAGVLARRQTHFKVFSKRFRIIFIHINPLGI